MNFPVRIISCDIGGNNIMKYLETIENYAGALSVSSEIWFIKNVQSSM